MDKDLIEKYKNELMQIYRRSQNSRARSASSSAAPAQTPIPSVPRPAPESTTVQDNDPRRFSTRLREEDEPYGENGKLVGVVTTVNRLYPVPNAKVSIFTGDYDDENMNVIDTDTTDRSGKTKAFLLPSPERELSLQPGSARRPYSSYNMLVEADGYINNVHKNIPVFRGVTSLQNSDLVLRTSANPQSGPLTFDEVLTYDL